MCGSFVVFLNGRLIDLDALGFYDSSDLCNVSVCKEYSRSSLVTLCLNRARSAGLSVSALATTGIKLTLELSRFMTSMSNGLSVWPVGRMK